MYLVTRLTGYDFPDIKAMIDRGLAARNRGKFVIDLKSSGNEQGNDWLRAAARQLPPERVVLDESDKVLLRETGVIGFASWGSNDSNRKERHLGFAWLPGAIMTEFVSTNARTFRRPPETWGLGKLEGRLHVVCGLTADVDGRCHSRWRDRRVRPCVRAISHLHAAARSVAAGLLPGAQPGRELLSFDTGFELDERGDRGSAVQPGQTGQPAMSYDLYLFELGAGERVPRTRWHGTSSGRRWS